MRKWILIGIGVLLLALGVGGALAFSNLNSYLADNREWLAAQAKQAVGRDVRFERIGVSFMGGLGVQIDQLAVGDDPAFSKEAFLLADEVLVRVRLWPAIMGKVEVARIVLRAPKVTVWKTQAGLSTDSLGGGAATPPAPSAGEAPPESPALLIALIDVRDARLRFVDSSGGKVVETLVEQLDFEASDVTLDAPIHFEASAALFSSPRQNAHVQGSVGPIDQAEASNSPLDLELSLDDLDIAALLANPAFASSIPPELTASGEIGLKAIVSGNLARMAIRWSFDGTAAAMRYDGALDKAKGTPLEIDLEGTLVGDALEIASGKLRLDRAALDIQGTVGLGEVTSYDLQVKSERLPLSGWERQLPATAGLGLSGNAKVDLGVVGSAAGKGLPKLNGSVGLDAVGAQLSGAPAISDLTGVLSLAKGGAKLPASGFKLGGAPATIAASVADLDKPVVVFDFSSPELTGAALGLEADSGVDALRKLSVKGQAESNAAGPKLRANASTASGTLSGLEYQNLEGVLRYAGNLATIEKLRFEAYGGVVTVDGKYDMSRANDPSFDVQTTIRGVRLEKLAASQFGATGNVLEGAIHTDLNLAGHGNDTEAIKRALTGKGRVELGEGVLRDVNIAESALSSVTGVPGLSNMLSPQVRQKHPGIFSTGDTRFEKLVGLLEIRDGQLQLKDLNLAARDYGIAARGSVGLDSRVNILATLTTSRELTQSLVGSSKAVRYIAGSSGTIQVPVKLGGTLDSLSAQPDVTELTSRIAQNAASTALTDILNKKLGGRRDTPAAPNPTETAPGADPNAPPREAPPPPVDPLEDLLRRGIEKGLGDLF